MKDQVYIEETAKGLDIVPINGRLLTDRRYFLTGEINSDTVISFAQSMLYFSAENRPISIYINSRGGEITSGLAIYDMIQGCQCEVNLFCIGQASSMAAVLLAAGQKGRRFILPNSRVMIHEVLLKGGVGGSATSICRVSQSILETREIVNSILARHTGKTIEEINDATSFDNVMNAEQAVEFGICDRIVNSLF